MRALAIVVLLAGTAHAIHTDCPKNAPGTIDVDTPPRDLLREEVEAPGDPGENFMGFTYGVLSGGGVVFAGDVGTRATGTIGAEVSLIRGQNDRSHYEDDFVTFPMRWEGLNLGWSAAQSTSTGGNGADWTVGPIYLEAERADRLGGGAAGWAVNPTNGDMGPQLTAFFFTLYVRANYFFDRGAEVTFGMQFKIPHLRVWSR